MARRRTRRTTRRPVTRRRRAARGFAFVPRGLVPTVASTAGGIVISDMVAQRIPGTETTQAATKIAVGLAGYLLLKRMLGVGPAGAFAAGAVTSAVLPFARRLVPGMSGVGNWGQALDVTPQFGPAARPQLAGYGDGDLGRVPLMFGSPVEVGV